MIATYALAGFASIPTMGISLGAYSVLAPKKTAALNKFLLKGGVAATIASYLTACVAGIHVHVVVLCNPYFHNNKFFYYNNIYN